MHDVFCLPRTALHTRTVVILIARAICPRARRFRAGGADVLPSVQVCLPGVLPRLSGNLRLAPERARIVALSCWRSSPSSFPLSFLLPGLRSSSISSTYLMAI